MPSHYDLAATSCLYDDQNEAGLMATDAITIHSMPFGQFDARKPWAMALVPALWHGRLTSYESHASGAIQSTAYPALH